MDNKKTGELIAKARKELGLTQKELAKKLHLSDRAVSKWERGVGFPDVSLLKPLAEALDLTISEIVLGKQGIDKTQELSDDEVLAKARSIIKKNISIQIRKKIVLTSLVIIFPFFISIFFWTYIPNEIAILVGTSSPYAPKLFAFTVPVLALLFANVLCVLIFEGKVQYRNLNMFTQNLFFPLLAAPTNSLLGKIYFLFRHGIFWIIPVSSWFFAIITYIRAFGGV
jgi:transcriptional regulator with XRE-family HTH domain